MNKRALINDIIVALTQELAILVRAAQASHAEATHESSKADNKYDTRGLEAAYLARGQSRKAAELQSAITDFEKLTPRNFATSEPIDIGALVEIEHKGERTVYFIGPKAGGTEVNHEKKEVLVITPQSPLGSQLMGKKQGDKVQLSLPGARDQYRIITVE